MDVSPVDIDPVRAKINLSMPAPKTNGQMHSIGEKIKILVKIDYPRVVERLTIDYGEPQNPDNILTEPIAIESSSPYTKEVLIVYQQPGDKRVTATIKLKENLKTADKKTTDTITIGKPPVIINHQIKCMPLQVSTGKACTLSVDVIEFGTMAYRWEKNGMESQDGQNKRLIISSMSRSNEGIYKCIALNNCGADTSKDMIISLTPAVKPVILDHPQSSTVTLNNPGRFSVRAHGIDLRYQWLRNGIDIVSATLPVYEIAKVPMQDNGARFKCLVQSGDQIAISNEAEMRVVEKDEEIKIIEQPTDVAVKIAHSTKFSLKVSGTNVSYQWHRGQDQIINGAQSSAYIIEKVAQSDNGMEFYCKASNSLGSVTSQKAKLSTINSFTVVYQGNGNNDGTVPVDGNSYETGAKATVLGNNGNLTKTGSTFAGWNTKPDGNGDQHAVGGTVTIGMENMFLYARWTTKGTYTVTYNGNGNTAGMVPVDGNNYESGSTAVVLGNTSSMTKTNATFIGWNTKADGSGVNYAVGNLLLIGTSNMTLYAVWNSCSTFTVTYDGNGSTSGTVPVDEKNYQTGASVTVLSNSNLIKQGATFVGWNTKVDGSGIDHAAGALFTMGSVNVVLYAKWSTKATYSVTYLGNGNTGGTAPVDENSYESGAAVIVKGNTGDLKKNGSTFSGWNTKGDGSGDTYTAGAGLTMGTEAVILYAKWSTKTTYTLTYLGNGNTAGKAPEDQNNYETGAQVTVQGNTGNLVKQNATFTGWNVKADGSGTPYTAGSKLTIGSENVVLFASWSVSQVYSVTYLGNGNTTGEPPVDNNKYEKGAKVTVKGNDRKMEKTASTFVGWNTKADGTGKEYTVGSTFIMEGEHLMLFAQWTTKQTYSVTYLGNGNTAGDPPVDDNKYETGQKVTVKGNEKSLEKTGSTFAGWNTKADGSGDNYAVGAIFTMSDAHVMLHAKWDAPSKFSITALSEGPGQIRPSGTISIEKGGSQSFDIVPSTAESEIVSVEVDGKDIGKAEKHLFTNISEDHTIKAIFRSKPKYKIEASTEGSGSIYPQGVQTVNHGEDISFRATPTSGWKLKAMRVDGKDEGSDLLYTFKQVTRDHQITAVFEEIPAHMIVATAEGPGRITPSGNVSVKDGRSQNFVITPTSSGQEIEAVFVDGSDVGKRESYLFENVTQDHTIKAVFKAKPSLTIEAVVSGSGSINPSGMVTVPYGGSATFRATPVAGWQFSAMMVDGNNAGNNPVYTFTNVTKNWHIRAHFDPIPTHTISASVGSGSGRITPSGTIRVDHGKSANFVAEPSNGWKVDALLVDGASVGPGPTYTFSNVTTDHDIKAIFVELPKHTINATAQGPGYIRPEGAITVSHGKSQNFSIYVQNDGAVLKDVRVDGQSVGTVSSYFFENVDRDHTIVAVFESKPTHIITASVVGTDGGAGSISPAGSVNVQHGQSITFTATPTSGSKIDAILVDGRNTGTGPSYTFSNVTTGHDIKAYFSKVSQTQTETNDPLKHKQ
ncbi:MAG: InlB B-repeat-containing protein [Chitinivibrionales bacterium]|nr:InlB B-repeat-containing protein [Chitinivibrionales bacterium]